MSVKAVLVLCAQAFFVQSALSQCIGAPGLAASYGLGAGGWGSDGLAAPFAYDGLAGWNGRGLACDGLYPAIAPAVDFTPTSGGALPVASASAFSPVGISVASENVYEGALAVAGELPFVGTVGLEGVLPTAGAGVVNHACGNGINAMISETTAFAPGYAGAAIAPGYVGAAIAPGYAGAAIAPAAAAIASGFAAPGLGYRAGFAGRGCGCAL